MHLAVTIDEAVEMIPDGSSIMLAGFMGVGTPDKLVRALAEAGKKDLTLISNDTARDTTGPRTAFCGALREKVDL